MNIFTIFPGSTLRGDEEFWDELKKEFIRFDFKLSPEIFDKVLDQKFLDLVSMGEMKSDDVAYFKSFSKNGMSAGYISLLYWKNVMLPTLKVRYRESHLK